MIHQNHGLLYGTAEDFARTGEFLAKADRELSALYGKRMNLTAKKVLALLQDETWYTSSEAVTAGLADGVVEIAQSPRHEKRVAESGILNWPRCLARLRRQTWYSTLRKWPTS